MDSFERVSLRVRLQPQPSCHQHSLEGFRGPKLAQSVLDRTAEHIAESAHQDRRVTTQLQTH